MKIMDSITILGARIDNFSVRETKENILAILEKSPEQKFAATLNPEIVLKAHRDEKYRHILNSADLNICDGFGLRLAGFLKGNRIKSRFTGVEMAEFLLENAQKRNLRVLVIASENSLSAPKEIEQSINKKYPDLSVKSQYHLPSQRCFENAIIKEAEIVFVNFGAPDQENFIFEHRAKFPAAKILVGVGGTFDFLTGKLRRAPRVFRAVGLEWLWRFAQEPKRLKRIWNAVIVFPTVALFGKN